MGLGSFRRALISGAVASVGAASVLPGLAMTTTVAADPAPIPAITGNIIGHLAGQAVPTTAECEAAFGIACFTGIQLEEHYGLPALYAAGLNGAGKTIAIVDSYGSPTITTDLHRFDRQLGLPNPTLRIIQPAGAVPPYDPTNATMVNWAFETTLDVEMAHSMAPGANILLVETPVAETEGMTGFPQMIHAENWVINHGMADVISQSFGATEETFPSATSIYNLRRAYTSAYDHQVTVLAAAGDNGATNAYRDGTCCYATAVNSWPSSDPLVTSVGGTQVHAAADGTIEPVADDTVWNDPNSILDGDPTDPTTCCAGGGGLSSVFPIPAFQNPVHKVVGTQRGTPDISMSAAVNGAALIYTSFGGNPVGWSLVGGTSESSPLFAGIVAIADQKAGHDLGLLNFKLYDLLRKTDSGLVDVTQGNNSLVFDDAHNHGALTTVTGFAAAPGYDLASGLGTIWAPTFIASLAK
jgi:subtilase family serine protease